LLENDKFYCDEELMRISLWLSNSFEDHPLNYVYNSGEEAEFIPSGAYRELAYNIEHVIHHMAIIKIALRQHFEEVTIPENFGIAPSTAKYLKGRNVHR